MTKLVCMLLAIALLPFSAAAAETMSRGAYLARVGDCTSCHTAPGHPLFSGGFKVNSPFGAIYGTNITPDRQYGIGDYSLRDFTRAVRQGIDKNGHWLYPAMPYPSFTRISDDDIRALYDYFMHEVPPVPANPPETHLPFPFSQRWGIRFWDWAFFANARFKPRADRDARWNRGAYLVQSLAHCGACHTPRGWAFEEKANTHNSSRFLGGETLDNWNAPNLSSNAASGLGRWSEEDIASFLGSGYGGGAIAFGTMRQVVENSSQYMTPEDRAAIAHYLKSIAAEGDQSVYHPNTKPATFERPGAGLYASSCARCHGEDGTGRPPGYPRLAGSAIVLSSDPTSLIRLALEGDMPPQTPARPKLDRMPGFARFTDQEIADVITFIRSSWGNAAAPVTNREVAVLRQKLQTPSE